MIRRVRGGSCSRLSNTMMALSMGILTAADYVILANKPTPLRFVMIAIMATLCLVFAYRAWRCSRV